MGLYQKILIGVLPIIVAIIAMIYKNKLDNKDTVTISKLNKYYDKCLDAISCIRNVFDIGINEKLYNNDTRKYIDSIEINRKILVAHLKNINHYTEVHSDMDGDSMNFIYGFYINLFNELDKLKYIDQYLLRTDITLFEIADKVMAGAAKFTLNTYKSLIDGDKEQYKIIADKFKQLNRQYDLRKEALKDLNNTTLEELEAKYKME